jgi:hypothetical protein
VTSTNFIGLDIHKKTISYCVKDVAGEVLAEGTISSTRRAWMPGCERCANRGRLPWKLEPTRSGSASRFGSLVMR